MIPGSLYSTFHKPSHWKFWITLAFLLHGLLFTYKIFEPHWTNQHYPLTFAYESGDSTSYFSPIENLFTDGNYADDYRMPGYGAIYFLLRLFLSISAVLNAMVILQLLASSLSVYFLSLISRTLFNNDSAFYVTFFIYGISTYVSLFNIFLLTESFCTASIIFSFYFLLKYAEEEKKYFLLLSGLMMTWAVFLRPVTAPLLVVMVIFLFLFNRKILRFPYAFAIQPLLLFILPFLLLDGLWAFRNYQKHQAFIPLNNGVHYPYIEKTYYVELIRFMNSFGGSVAHWNPGSEMSFFIYRPQFHRTKTKIKLPSYIYTSKFNYDSLVVLQNYIREYEGDSVNAERKKYLNDVLTQKFSTYAESVKKEKPFVYYISSRVKVLIKFFFHSGTYNLFAKAGFELNIVQLVFKVFYSLLYFLVLTLGFLGCLLMFWDSLKKHEMKYSLIAVPGLYLALVFPLLFKLDEARYFVPAYPFFVIASVYSLKVIIDFSKRKLVQHA